MSEAYASIQAKIVKRGFAWACASGLPIWPSAATAPMLGSSQNDLVFSSMLSIGFVLYRNILCREVSIDNESDQAT